MTPLRPLPTAQRIYFSLLQLLLVLPFATIADCQGKGATEYTGIGLFFGKGGPVLVAPYLFLLLGFLIFPFEPTATPVRAAVLLSLRSGLSGLAGSIIFILPWFTGIFDTVKVKPAWMGMVAGWVMAWFVYLAGSWLSYVETEERSWKEAAMVVVATVMAGVVGCVVRSGGAGIDPVDAGLLLIYPQVLVAPLASMRLGLDALESPWWRRGWRLAAGLWVLLWWGVAFGK